MKNRFSIQLALLQQWCHSLDNLPRHWDFGTVYISHLSAAYAPFYGIRYTLKILWTRTQKALHAGQSFHCGAFDDIDDGDTDQTRCECHMRKMDSNGATHRMSHDVYLWCLLRIEFHDQIANVPKRTEQKLEHIQTDTNIQQATAGTYFDRVSADKSSSSSTLLSPCPRRSMHRHWQCIMLVTSACKAKWIMKLYSYMYSQDRYIIYICIHTQKCAQVSAE